MAVQTPVIYNNGTVMPLPAGDTVSGASGDISALPVNTSLIYPVPDNNSDVIAIGSTYWTVSGKRVAYNSAYHDLSQISARYKEYGSDVVVGSSVAFGGTYYPILWDGSQWMVIVTGTTSNNLFTSPDGVTWTARTIYPISFSNTCTLATNGSIWIAGNNTTAFYTSTDAGVTWTSRTSGPSNVTSIVWNGSKFVAGTSSGQPSYSTDGITWTSGTGAATNTHRVIWTGTSFLCCPVSGNSLSISRSTDGITWTNQSLGSSGTYGAIAYGNGYVIVVSIDGVVYRSSNDGVTWSVVSNLVSAKYSCRLVFVGGLFWLRSQYYIATSSDGVSWTYVSAIPGINTFAGDVVHNGSYFLMTQKTNSTMLYKLQTYSGTPAYIGTLGGAGSSVGVEVGTPIIRTK
jgi:hypothetical protein